MDEDEYLMLSGLQHFAFCRRQWALIHVEQQWAENYQTTAGELMHERAHDEALIEKFESGESTKITPANVIVITTILLGVVTYIIEKIWLHIKVGTIDNGVELLGLIAFISLMITANWRDINKLFVKNRLFFWAMLAFVVILGVPYLTDFVQGFIDGFVAGAHAN